MALRAFMGSTLRPGLCVSSSRKSRKGMGLPAGTPCRSRWTRSPGWGDPRWPTASAMGLRWMLSKPRSGRQVSVPEDRPRKPPILFRPSGAFSSLHLPPHGSRRGLPSSATPRLSPQSLSENPGARLCRPRPAAASPKISVPWSVLAVLRLVFDTAALHF